MLKYNLAPKIVQMFGDKYLSQYEPIGLNSRYELAARILLEAIQTGDVETLKTFSELAKLSAEQMPLNQSVEQKGKELQKKVEEALNKTSNYIKQQEKTITMRHLKGKDDLLKQLLDNPSAFGISLYDAPNKIPGLLHFPPLTYYPYPIQNLFILDPNYYGYYGPFHRGTQTGQPSTLYPLPGGPIDKGKKK